MPFWKKWSEHLEKYCRSHSPALKARRDDISPSQERKTQSHNRPLKCSCWNCVWKDSVEAGIFIANVFSKWNGVISPEYSMKLIFISRHPGIYPAVLKDVRTCYRNVLCPKPIKRMNLRLAFPADNPAYNPKRLMPCHLKIHWKLRKRSFNQSIWDMYIFKLAKDFYPSCGFVLLSLLCSVLFMKTVLNHLLLQRIPGCRIVWIAKKSVIAHPA